MKKRVYTINNKRIVEGDPNLVTSNEVLLQQSNDGIKLVERVNGELKTVSKGDNNSGGGDGEEGDLPPLQRYGCVLVTPYAISMPGYPYQRDYDRDNQGYIDWDKYIVPITYQSDVNSGVSKAVVTIHSSLLKEITYIPINNSQVSSSPTNTTAGYLISLGLYKDKEQCLYVTSRESNDGENYLPTYLKEQSLALSSGSSLAYALHASGENYLSIKTMNLQEVSATLNGYNYPDNTYLPGGVEVILPDELAGSVQITFSDN